MSARRSDRLIIVALLVALLGLALLSFVGNASRDGQVELQGSSLNPAPPGTLAFYRWLEDAGYPVTRIQGSGYTEALRQSDVVFVLNPQTAFTPAQIAALDAWVAAGGVLVASLEGSGLTPAVNPLTAHFGAHLDPLFPPISGALVPDQPVWQAPPVRLVRVQTSWQLSLDAADAVVLLRAGGSALIVTQPHGRGRLILLSTTWPLSNAGLGDPASDNRWLAWNLAGAGPGRRVAFDEVHHGYTGSDLRAVALQERGGWALIFGVGGLALGLLLGGRRLGPPLAAAPAGARRGAADYVTALAGLFGRAGRSDWVAAHYRSEFRHALAAPYGLDAGAPAAAFAAAYSSVHDRPVDQAALHQLLLELDAAAQPGPRGRPTIGDAALLRLVRRAEAFRSAG